MSDSPVQMTQEPPGSISQTEVMPEIRRPSYSQLTFVPQTYMLEQFKETTNAKEDHDVLQSGL